MTTMRSLSRTTSAYLLDWVLW